MSRHLSERDWLSPTYEAPREPMPEGDEDAECVWCGEPGADDEFGVHCLAVHSACMEDYHRSVAPEDFCPTCEREYHKCDCPEET